MLHRHHTAPYFRNKRAGISKRSSHLISFSSLSALAAAICAAPCCANCALALLAALARVDALVGAAYMEVDNGWLWRKTLL